MELNKYMMIAAIILKLHNFKIHYSLFIIRYYKINLKYSA